MKKQYIQPSMKAYRVQPMTIMAASNMENAGSNNVSGGPTSAESKSGFDLGLDLDGDEE